MPRLRTSANFVHFNKDSITNTLQAGDTSLANVLDQFIAQGAADPEKAFSCFHKNYK